LRVHRATFNDADNRFFCQDLVDEAIKLGHERVTVYGAGKIGLDMVAVARAKGLCVDFVVDSDETLHGTVVKDISVVSLEHAATLGARVFLVASVAFASAICESIRCYHESTRRAVPVIISNLHYVRAGSSS
jgi:hypothetical protein